MYALQPIHPSSRDGASRRFDLRTLVVLTIALAALLAPDVSPAHQDSDSNPDAWMSGTWDSGRARDGRDLWLNLRQSGEGGSNWSRGLRLSSKDVDGLPRGNSSGRTPVDLRVKRDAGTIHLTGEFNGSRGGGTFELELDPAFPGELERRGVGRPTPAQQAKLLVAGADFSLLDALAREKYPAPRLPMLLRMADHGVDEIFVAGMAKAGYRLESLETLVQARDHGVDPSFIQGMAEAGYRNLEFELLLRARDHGADPDFAADMAEAGYRNLPLATLIKARDHGVDGNFVEGLRQAGFEKLTLEAVIRARDHGVSNSFAKRVRAKRPGATLDEVIALRDRGESP